MRSCQQEGKGEGGRGLGIMSGTGMANYQGRWGPGWSTSREWKLPGLSPSWKIHPTTRPRTIRYQDSEKNLGRARQGHRGTEGPATGKNPMVWKVHMCRLRASKQGAHHHRNGVRFSHSAGVTGTSGRGWWVAGAGDFHVDINLYQDRRWGADEK